MVLSTMASDEIGTSDRLTLVDRARYAFDSVISLRTDVTQLDDKTEQQIELLFQELKALKKIVKEIREEVFPDPKKLIDDEALEVNPEDIEDQGEQEPDVIFDGVTTTFKKKKKRRLE